MATIDPTYDKNNPIEDSIQPQWALLAGGDVGEKVLAGNYNDKTFHVISATGTVTLRGSNKRDADVTVATDWFTLKDVNGANIAVLGAQSGGAISGNPMWISPIAATNAVTIGVLGKK